MIVSLSYATVCPDEDVLRELMSYDILNPYSVPLICSAQKKTQPVEHWRQSVFMPYIEHIPCLHWSRQYEYIWAINSANLQKNHDCLDAGGAGFSSLKYAVAKRCNSVTVVDLDQDSLNMNEHYGHKMKIDNIEYFCEDISNFKLEKRFDRIFCISVLEHIESLEEKRKCVRNMIDHLKPHGEMFLSFDILLHEDTDTTKLFDKTTVKKELIQPIFDELQIGNLPDGDPTIGKLQEGTKLVVLCAHYKKTNLA